MATKKKVLRYTEEEFVTLLENIVKRVKKEQIVESRKKEARKKQLSENIKNLKKNRRTKNRPQPNSGINEADWRNIDTYSDMERYGGDTKWSIATDYDKRGSGERLFNAYYEKHGTIMLYTNGPIKIACVGGECYDQNDYLVSRDDAAQLLGVQSLDDIPPAADE